MSEQIRPCECGIQPTVQYWGEPPAKMDIFCENYQCYPGHWVSGTDYDKVIREWNEHHAKKGE